MERFADKPHAMFVLFAIAFAESSFFPIPPDILLIAIAVSNPKRSLEAALWCTLGSLLGGILGYYIGFGLMESVGVLIKDAYSLHDKWDSFVQTYEEVGNWFLLGAAFTPIPYKVATIASGATEMPLIPFILISTIGRAGRFFLVGGLFRIFGAQIKVYIDKYFDKLSLAFIILLIAGFYVVKVIL